MPGYRARTQVSFVKVLQKSANIISIDRAGGFPQVAKKRRELREVAPITDDTVGRQSLFNPSKFKKQMDFWDEQGGRGVRGRTFRRSGGSCGRRGHARGTCRFRRSEQVVATQRVTKTETNRQFIPTQDRLADKLRSFPTGPGWSIASWPSILTHSLSNN